MNIAKNRTIAHPNPVEMAQNVSVLVTLISAIAHLVSLGPVVRTTRTNANKNLANMGNVITLMEVTHVLVVKVTLDRIAKTNTFLAIPALVPMEDYADQWINIRTHANALWALPVQTARRTSTTAEAISVKTVPLAWMASTVTPVNVHPATPDSTASKTWTNVLKGLQCVKMGLLAPIASEDSAVSASMVGQGWTVALTSMIVQGRLVSMVLLVLTEWVAFIVGVRLEKLVFFVTWTMLVRVILAMLMPSAIRAQ